MSGISGAGWDAAANVFDRYQQGQDVAEKRANAKFLQNVEKQKMFNETIRTGLENMKLENEIAQLDPNMVPVFRQMQGALSMSMLNDQFKEQPIDTEQLNSQASPMERINLMAQQDQMRPAYDPRMLLSLPEGYVPFSKREEKMIETRSRRNQIDPETQHAMRTMQQIRSQRAQLAKQKESKLADMLKDPFARRQVGEVEANFDQQISELDTQLMDWETQYPQFAVKPAKKSAGEKIQKLIQPPPKSIQQQSAPSAAPEEAGLLDRIGGYIGGVVGSDAQVSPEYNKYQKALGDYVSGRVNLKDMPNEFGARRIVAAKNRIDQLVKNKKISAKEGARLKGELERADLKGDVGF